MTPFLPPDRQITLQLPDLLILIRNGYPKFHTFSPEAQKHFDGLELGSCLLRYEPSSDVNYSGPLTATIILPFFRAHVSASLLLDKAERKSLAYRLTGETIESFPGMEKEDIKIANAKTDSNVEN